MLAQPLSLGGAEDELCPVSAPSLAPGGAPALCSISGAPPRPEWPGMLSDVRFTLSIDAARTDHPDVTGGRSSGWLVLGLSARSLQMVGAWGRPVLVPTHPGGTRPPAALQRACGGPTRGGRPERGSSAPVVASGWVKRAAPLSGQGPGRSRVPGVGYPVFSPYMIGMECIVFCQRAPRSATGHREGVTAGCHRVRAERDPVGRLDGGLESALAFEKTLLQCSSTVVHGRGAGLSPHGGAAAARWSVRPRTRRARGSQPHPVGDGILTRRRLKRTHTWRQEACVVRVCSASSDAWVGGVHGCEYGARTGITFHEVGFRVKT
jgi:hypothetical protein